MSAPLSVITIHTEEDTYQENTKQVSFAINTPTINEERHARFSLFDNISKTL